MNPLLSLPLLALAGAGPIELAPGRKIEAGGRPIDIRVGHLVPAVTDWNGDGRKDLLVRQFLRGRIRLYLNEGDEGRPVFKTSRFLKAGGKVISLPAG
jgi:hypothetical protein